MKILATKYVVEEIKQKFFHKSFKYLYFRQKKKTRMCAYYIVNFLLIMMNCNTIGHNSHF